MTFGWIYDMFLDDPSWEAERNLSQGSRQRDFLNSSDAQAESARIVSGKVEMIELLHFRSFKLSVSRSAKISEPAARHAMTNPREYMSLVALRLSVLGKQLGSWNSGAVQRRVPINRPSISRRFRLCCGKWKIAWPKSESLGPVCVMRMFSNFMSLWSTSAECRYSRAEVIS